MTPFILREGSATVDPLASSPSHSTRLASSSRWIEALSHLAPKYGGLTATVPQLSRNLEEQEDFRIDLASFAATDESGEVDSSLVSSITQWPASRLACLFDRRLSAKLRAFVSQASGVHLHGLWEAHTAILGRVARKLGKPYLVSAHGMLDPWALANKGWKKTLYSLFVERPNMQRAACLHALTLAEAEDYRRFGCTAPIAVIPNGIELPRSVDPSIFLDRYPTLREKRLVLFLGRIHFKKGLDILVEAWSKMQVLFPDALLVLAGPDSEGSMKAVEQMVTLWGISSSVIFTGMLDSEFKWSALANAHAFVLPSYSEGFSVAVLEAMGMGVPVIVTRECHVPEVQAVGAGWQIAPCADDLAAALAEMLLNSAEANAEIGNRGRRLVRDRFSCRTVTQQMAELYRWVEGGPRPTSFQVMEVDA